MRDRVDHPRKGSKDLADAVCGSVFNAISRTRPDVSNEIQVHTYDSMNYTNDFEDDVTVTKMNIIRAPMMPSELSSALESMRMI